MGVIVPSVVPKRTGVRNGNAPPPASSAFYLDPSKTGNFGNFLLRNAGKPCLSVNYDQFLKVIFGNSEVINLPNQMVMFQKSKPFKIKHLQNNYLLPYPKLPLKVSGRAQQIRGL